MKNFKEVEKLKIIISLSKVKKRQFIMPYDNLRAHVTLLFTQMLYHGGKSSVHVK